MQESHALVALQSLFLSRPAYFQCADRAEYAGRQKTADIESRRTQLLALFDEEWQYELRSDPEMATSIGDNRYNDRLSDHSPAFYQSDVEARRKFLARFEALIPQACPRRMRSAAS